MNKPRHRVRVDGNGRVWYQYTCAHTGNKNWFSPFTEEEKIRMAASSVGWKLAKFINIGGN